MTHLYFAQSLLWAMPLLDPRLQRAIKKFPELVMTGACLPDLAVLSRRFQQTHLWEFSHALLASAKNDEETAIAIGFASHLYVDVIAHHHFVPAHEAMWFQYDWLKTKHQAHSFITHITCEWAMDAHLAPLVDTSPTILLRTHQALIVAFISPQFKCTHAVTKKALNRLAFWDNVLRSIKLPNAIYQLAKCCDEKVFKHFVYYIAKTQLAMHHIGLALNGQKPGYAPELHNLNLRQLDDWRQQCVSHLNGLHPKPIEYFSHLNTTTLNK